MKQKTNSLFSFTAILLLAVFSLVSLFVAFNASTQVNAQSVQKAAECGSGVRLNTDGECSLADQEKDCKDRVTGTAKEKSQKCSSESNIEKLITNIINTLSVLVGAICVIMIIVGGFRYVTSAGESNSVSGAKNTILYAIVGLIIVAFAQIIVQFVLQRIVA